MTRRRPTRSAHTPPTSAKSAKGIPPAARTRPRSLAEPSPRTAKAMATGVMRSPMTDSAWPQKRSLNEGCSRKEAGSLRWTGPDGIAAGA